MHYLSSKICSSFSCDFYLLYLDYIKNRTKTELGFINVKQKQQTKNSFSKENANIENRLVF